MAFITTEETVYDTTIHVLRVTLLTLEHRRDAYAVGSREHGALGIAIAAVRAAKEEVFEAFTAMQMAEVEK